MPKSPMPPSPQTGPATLTVLDGPTAGAVYRLDRDILVLGRGDPGGGVVADIDLSAAEGAAAGSALSRRHAEIRRMETGLSVRDLGSTNGTTLNGAAVPIDPPQPLRHGDRLGLGKVHLAVTCAERGAPPPVPPRRRGLTMVAAGVAAMVLGVSAIDGLAPARLGRMLALPALLSGHWTARACAAFPEPCRRALDTRLAVEIVGLDSLVARLDEAIGRTETELARRRARLGDQQRFAQALREAGAAKAFPVTVNGETFAAGAALDARVQALDAGTGALTAGIDQVTALHGDLIARRSALVSRRIETQSKRDLLPVETAQADIADLLRGVAADRAAADPVLRDTEDLVHR